MNPPNHTELRIVKDLLRYMFEFVSGVMDQEGNESTKRKCRNFGCV